MNDEIEIKLAIIDDLQPILSIYEKAKIFMKENGNPNQWNKSYPTTELLITDIENKQLYIVTSNNTTHAVFAFIIGNDPTYEHIEGEWFSNSVYGTIHRIASDGELKGVFKMVLSFCFDKINHIRIDTHRDNIIMRNLISYNGFQYCGIIHLSNGDERLAFEKIS